MKALTEKLALSAAKLEKRAFYPGAYGMPVGGPGQVPFGMGNIGGAYGMPPYMMHPGMMNQMAYNYSPTGLATGRYGAPQGMYGGYGNQFMTPPGSILGYGGSSNQGYGYHDPAYNALPGGIGGSFSPLGGHGIYGAATDVDSLRNEYEQQEAAIVQNGIARNLPRSQVDELVNRLRTYYGQRVQRAQDYQAHYGRPGGQMAPRPFAPPPPGMAQSGFGQNNMPSYMGPGLLDPSGPAGSSSKIEEIENKLNDLRNRRSQLTGTAPLGRDWEAEYQAKVNALKEKARATRSHTDRSIEWDNPFTQTRENYELERGSALNPFNLSGQGWLQDDSSSWKDMQRAKQELDAFNQRYKQEVAKRVTPVQTQMDTEIQNHEMQLKRLREQEAQRQQALTTRQTRQLYHQDKAEEAYYNQYYPRPQAQAPSFMRQPQSPPPPVIPPPTTPATPINTARAEAPIPGAPSQPAQAPTPAPAPAAPVRTAQAPPGHVPPMAEHNAMKAASFRKLAALPFHPSIAALGIPIGATIAGAGVGALTAPDDYTPEGGMRGAHMGLHAGIGTGVGYAGGASLGHLYDRFEAKRLKVPHTELTQGRQFGSVLGALAGGALGALHANKRQELKPWETGKKPILDTLRDNLRTQRPAPAFYPGYQPPGAMVSDNTGPFKTASATKLALTMFGPDADAQAARKAEGLQSGAFRGMTLGSLGGAGVGGLTSALVAALMHKTNGKTLLNRHTAMDVASHGGKGATVGSLLGSVMGAGLGGYHGYEEAKEKLRSERGLLDGVMGRKTAAAMADIAAKTPQKRKASPPQLEAIDELMTDLQRKKKRVSDRTVEQAAREAHLADMR